MNSNIDWSVQDFLQKPVQESLLHLARVAVVEHEFPGLILFTRSRLFSEAIAKQPERFVDEAIQFENKNAASLFSFFDGLKDARRAKRNFQWKPVLQLAKRVVAQSATGVVQKYEHDINIIWVRGAISRLMEDAFDVTYNPIEYNLRKEAWEVIVELLKDEIVKSKLRIGNEEIEDPMHDAINSTRGCAFQAAIMYGLWVREDWLRRRTTKTDFAPGWEEFPELRDAIIKHLDDTEKAMRALYGRYYPQLCVLDNKWATSKDIIARIFPENRDPDGLRDAAWLGYVCYANLYNDIAKILENVYSRSVDLLDSKSLNKYRGANPDEQLADHLMFLQARDIFHFDPNDSSNIIVRFFNNAAPWLRGHALESVGRALERTEEEIPDEMLINSVNLWKWRSSEAIKAAPEDQHLYFDEMEAFGWWFYSGQFDNNIHYSKKWALDQLYQSIGYCKKTAVDHGVVQKLTEYADEEPEMCIRCLGEMVKGSLDPARPNSDRWDVFGYKDEAYKLLKKVIEKDRATFGSSVAEMINNFRKFGDRFEHFSDLLINPTSNP